MSQVDARSGAVKAYYSWRVQNPSEVFHDVMVEVENGSVSVHIGWKDRTKRSIDDRPTSIVSNETITVIPLYGAVVGVESGQNEFTLSFEDSDDRTPVESTPDSTPRDPTESTHMDPTESTPSSSTSSPYVPSGSARCFCRSSLLLATTVTLLHNFVGYCSLYEGWSISNDEKNTGWPPSWSVFFESSVSFCF